MAKSTNPLAPTVAREYGVRCAVTSRPGEQTEWTIDVCQRDFDEALAEMVAEGRVPHDAARAKAYDSLQSEGFGRDF